MKSTRAGGLWLPALLAVLTSCAAIPAKAPSTADAIPGARESVVIGPYREFSGRLLVFEPNRRWQVTLQWAASDPRMGWARLTHAASNTVIELRWRGDAMRFRSNSQPEWKTISRQQLSEQGIVLPPRQLASLLLGRMPRDFVRKPGGTEGEFVWETPGRKPFLRLRWRPAARRLSITDITHGRRAVLIIQHIHKPSAGHQP